LGKFELSPDGSMIVFINQNGQLHFVSTNVSTSNFIFSFRRILLFELVERID